MTPSDAGAVLRLIFSSWPTQRMRMSSDDVAAMTASYFAGLSDLDSAQVRKAIIRLAQTAEWIPTIAAIRREVGIVAVGRQRTGMDAWGDVHDAQRKYGSHRWPGVDFSLGDPLVARVVSSIGWLEICSSTNPDHVRARFIDAYEQAAATERTAMAASPGANANPQLEVRADRTLERGEEVRPALELVRSLLPPPVDDVNDAPCAHEGSECPDRCRCVCDRCFARVCELARQISGDT